MENRMENDIIYQLLIDFWTKNTEFRSVKKNNRRMENTINRRMENTIWFRVREMRKALTTPARRIKEKSHFRRYRTHSETFPKSY